jgi:general secretion pathway protein C
MNLALPRITMNQRPRRHHPVGYVAFAALGLASWIQVSAVTRWLGAHVAPLTKPLAPVAALDRENTTQSATIAEGSEREAKNDPRAFGSALSPSTADRKVVHRRDRTMEDPYRAPDCALTAQITLITASQNGTASVALVTEPGLNAQRPRMLREGEEYAGRRVWHIGSDRLWLRSERDKESCQLRMYETPVPDPSPGSAVSAVAAPQIKGGRSSDLAKSIQRMSATEFNVDRSLFERVLQDPTELLRVRVVPEQDHGIITGMRLFGIRPDTLLGVVGFANGDRLNAINGMPINDPEGAMAAYARLRSEKHLVVSVNRGEKEVNIDIHVI